MTGSWADVHRAVAFALLIGSASLTALSPIVVLRATYVTYQVGGLVGPRPYLPLIVPVALLAAASWLVARGERDRWAAYLSLAGASYYITVVLDELRRAAPGTIVVPFPPYLTLVGPGRAYPPYVPLALSAASAVAAISLAARGWLPRLAAFMLEAERLARAKFGVDLETLRRRFPGIAEAVVTYARFGASHGASTPSALASLRSSEAVLRRVADREARRRYGVPLERLEAERPHLARALLEAARYLPQGDEQ